MYTAICLFAKTPNLTPAKTRLATQIGTEATEILYALTLDYVLSTCNEVIATSDATNQWKLIVNAAEAQAIDHPFWRNYEVIHDEFSDLGDKLDHCYQKLQTTYDQVCLIGADCISLSPENFFSASDKLNAGAQIAIGPSYDGGFYLFASRQQLNSHIWKNCTYSQASTLLQLELLLTADHRNYRINRLEPLWDIDLLAHLPQVHQELLAKAAQNNFIHLQQKQRNIANFIATIIAKNNINSKPS